MSIKIFTPYGPKPPRRAAHAGNRMEPHFVERYDENGHPYLVKDGETDMYALIQSHKDECDINLLIQRYAAGDTSMLHSGIYVDTSELPSNIHEMFNFMNSQREKFEALPVEIKQRFENSFEVWATAAGSQQWLEKMGLNKKEEPKKEAVTDGES